MWKGRQQFLGYDKTFLNWQKIQRQYDHTQCNDKTVTDPCEVAQIFNKYFVSIASAIDPPDPIILADEAISTH